MLALGFIGAAGQYLVFESFRHAPASLLAPTEYVMLIGAFLHGYVFFHEIPTFHTYAGAALIVAGTAILIVLEARGRR
jgi:S-adenosylmethionine uptake transporter